MKSIQWNSCNEEELWKYVASHLKNNGIDSVLVGGAVVSIYSEGIYTSGDLDFLSYDMRRISEILEEIGFKKQHRHYIHPECSHLFIEFVAPPLAIGNDYEIVPVSVVANGQMIKILSPTDCVKDRLASYIHFQARECLDQAVLVAQKHPVDFNEIRLFCDQEETLNHTLPKTYSEFFDLFKKLKDIE